MRDHISVCIVAFRRARTLERLLRNVAAQDTGGLFDLSAVVVDNDVEAASARDVVSRLAPELALDLTYAVGRVNTIPAARNHALRLAVGNYIAIIDDDEFPPPHWLLTLYRAIRVFDVAGALGPVEPFFENTPPAWLIKGRFCERPTHRTGTLLSWNQTRTGNVLIKRKVFEDLCFDETFTTGGSDREFFKAAIKRGCRFVAVEEAAVHELVSLERQTKLYWLRRGLVNGFNAHKNATSELSVGGRVTLLVRLVAAVCLYAVATPLSALVGTHAVVACLERGGHHFSRLCAMFGVELVKQRTF